MSAPHADRDRSEEPGFTPRPGTFDEARYPQPEPRDVRSRHVVGDGPSIVGMVDSFGRPATVFTPPEDLRRDPARWPTPEEFVTEWERYTPDQRLQLAERILADGQAVADCTIHLMKRREVEAERDELRAEVERLTDEREAHCDEIRRHWGSQAARQHHRAETAEAKVARVEALAEQWEAATIWPDKPHRSLRGAAARLRIALSGESGPAEPTTEQRTYATDHGFTPPTGPFGRPGEPERCRVMLARYACPYSREEHDPSLPPVDLDVFGYRRKGEATGDDRG